MGIRIWLSRNGSEWHCPSTICLTYMSGLEWKKHRIYLQYHKSKEIKLWKGYYKDDWFLSCFLCYWRTRSFVGTWKNFILENGYDRIKQECLLLKLVTSGNRLVGQEWWFPETLIIFRLSMKEYHSGGAKKRLDSKIDERGVVESNIANNVGLEC